VLVFVKNKVLLYNSEGKEIINTLKYKDLEEE